MKRVWIAILLIVLGIAAVKAMPVEQQLIIFGGQSSASGGGGSCAAAPDGSVDLSECSNAFYVAVIL